MVVFCGVLGELWVVVVYLLVVLVSVGGIGGGKMKARTAVELEASSSVMYSYRWRL